MADSLKDCAITSKPKKPAPVKATANQAPRAQHGRTDRSVMFPVAVQASAMPADYAAWFNGIKTRIQGERLRLMLASTSVMVLL